ncbi:dienelactone hydrolase family protein [Rhodococcus globerulus]|uniref:Dienelactone hydrolase family protein n=1 Tax=Rhodococcus globerulus TaxID=33008 RepID=A0ABU4C568_RHOGO|nr:dienelactone hydrolase family protein [Rhodococcus globerulus]MDV6271419.1 dienelactone hydrolase family protein [Rhodococcus globerulus]
MPHVTVLCAPSPKGGVVLLQEAFGVTPYLLDVGRQLVDVGWNVAIPHLYHRSGSPTFYYNVNNGDGVDDRQPEAERAASQAIVPHALALSESGVMQDVDDSITALGSVGIAPENIGLVGFCFGGSVALYASATRALGAAVVFYGAGIRSSHFSVPAFTEVAEGRQTPLLGLYGALDKHIPSEDVEALELAVNLSRAAGSVRRFPAAEHGFHSKLRSAYEPQSAEAAWATALDWLHSYASAK